MHAVFHKLANGNVQKFKLYTLVCVYIALVISFGIIIWLSYIRPQSQVFSGINLMRQQIRVEVAGEQVLLDTYDTYHISTIASGETTLTVTDTNGSILETRRHSLQSQPGLAIDIYTEPDNFFQCVIKADVTGKYYQTTNSITAFESRDITQIQTVTRTSTNSIYIPLDRHKVEYVYPDTYQAQNLPSQLDTVTKVFGYYLVPCEDLGDQAKLTDWIHWWGKYVPGEQRAKYLAQLQTVLETTRYTK